MLFSTSDTYSITLLVMVLRNFFLRHCKEHLHHYSWNNLVFWRFLEKWIHSLVTPLKHLTFLNRHRCISCFFAIQYENQVLHYFYLLPIQSWYSVSEVLLSVGEFSIRRILKSLRSNDKLYWENEINSHRESSMLTVEVHLNFSN